MTDWLPVLTVLSVAAVLACFRFAGCTLPVEGLPGGPPPDYNQVIRNETSLVAYWRLGEGSMTVAGDLPTPGDAAKDEIGTAIKPTGAHPGTYQQIVLDTVSDSPATANPAIFHAGKPGLLTSDPNAHSVQVDGGFVRVPFTSTFNPTDKFSVEAWVNPEWDVNEAKVYRCVVASRQDTGDGFAKFGYIIYAGPSTPDPMKQDDQMYWQAWVGDGTKYWQILVMDQPLKHEPTYLLLTWDGVTTITLDALPVSATTSTRKTMQAAYKAVTDTTIPLLIGMGTPDFTPLHYPFNGRLQEIAFYNAALTTMQVKEHVKAAKGA